MAHQKAPTTAEAPQDAAVDAQVNAPALVTIFDNRGTPMQVPPDTAEMLIAVHGFKRTKVDVASAATAFQVLFEAASTAIGEYVSGVLADGHIDPDDQAAQATAMHAMRAIEVAWNDLMLEIARQYPVRQGEPVKMIEQRATVLLNGTPYDVSLVELAARRTLEPENPAYADDAIVLTEREVDVDPAQVGQYVTTPGWRVA